MRTINRLFVVYALLVLSGCTSGSQTPSITQGQTATASPAATSSSGGVAIEFLSEPDPPKAGDNTIAVTVRQPDGTAITDAAVTAVFSMPAMPAMNMPAMRSDAAIQAALISPRKCQK